MEFYDFTRRRLRHRAPGVQPCDERRGQNAIDYLHREWKHKAIGFVSYGGVAAGTRAVQVARAVATSLSMVPVYEGVNIPFFRQYIGPDGVFVPDTRLEDSAQAMLDALALCDSVLRTLREHG